MFKFVATWPLKETNGTVNVVSTDLSKSFEFIHAKINILTSEQ